MRLTGILACAAFTVACSKADAPPATDTAASSAAAVETPAPAMSLATVAGKWNMRVMSMDNDSTLTTHVLTAAAEPTGWSFLQPSGEVVPVRNVVLSGDSITAEAGPFGSGVRKGMRVRDLRTTYRMQGDKLVGVTTAKYANAGADSVRQFRLEGTRTQ